MPYSDLNFNRSYATIQKHVDIKMNEERKIEREKDKQLRKTN
jgi:hypothetical protein